MVFRYRSSHRIGPGRYIGNSFSGKQAVVATLFDVGFGLFGSVLGGLIKLPFRFMGWIIRKPVKGLVVVLFALMVGSLVSRTSRPLQPSAAPTPNPIVAQPLVMTPPAVPVATTPPLPQLRAKNEEGDADEAPVAAERPRFVPDPKLQKIIADRKARQSRIATQKRKAQTAMERQLQAEAEAARASGGGGFGLGGGSGGASSVCGALTQEGTSCQRRVAGGGRCYQHQ